MSSDKLEKGMMKISGIFCVNYFLRSLREI